MTVRHKPNSCKLYLQKSVLDAAQERIAWIFDTFETISVSVSGGKDSTVLFDLAYREAERRNRSIHCFFLDQEAEYEASIEIIDEMMRRPLVIPVWYQVPCRMTNATSYDEEWLYAWDPDARDEWVHPQVDISIKEPLPVDRFYRIMEYADQSWGPNSASLVGLRSEESLNRYGAVTRHPAIPGVNWSSRSSGESVKLYPIYDWTFEDVWTYIANAAIPYNRIYDFMYAKQMRLTEMRVSNLIHEKAFKSLTTLQEFEPETYDRIVARLKGVHVAARYGKDQLVFSTRKRPRQFKTWLDYRQFLLDTYTGEHKDVFLARFAREAEREAVYRQQCHQLQINDWEANVPVKDTGEREDALQKWMDIL